MKMNILIIIVGIFLVCLGVFRIVRQSSSTQEDRSIDFSEKVSKPTLSEDIPAITFSNDSTERTYNRKDVAEEKAVDIHKKNEESIASVQDSKSKGNEFENFVANFFTDRNKYTVLEWNQGQTSSQGVYAKADENPDFKIEHKLSDDFKITYWVECKYRSSFNSDAVIIKDYQLNRYRKIQRESHRKVLVAIGVGGTPSSPKSFYLVPLDSIDGEKISFDDLKPFYMSSPKERYDYWVTSYFRNKVFKKAKGK